MNCIHPVNIVSKNSLPTLKRLFRHGKIDTPSMEVPCGKCINCLIAKQSSLTFLANRELIDVYRKGGCASFVTMTYDDNHLPINECGKVTLRKRDVQLWLKNLRRNMEYHNDHTKFKYILCGEYGDSFGRPHYHIVLLGLSDSKARFYTRKLWRHGLCDIGVLTAGGIRYVCKYLTKQHPTKEVKELREKYNVENPFLTHSIGIGKDWVARNVQKIADDDFQFVVNGKKRFYPKWIMQYVSLRTSKDYRPIVKRYFMDKVYRESHKNGFGCDIVSYEEDYTYLTYMNNVQALRSKGIPVKDELGFARRYYKPYHHADRSYMRGLVDLALYGDVVPF